MENKTFGFQESRLEHQNRQKPENYLALSIISTILGFCSCIGLFAGIVAIVFSAQSSTKFNNGDYEGSVKTAKVAKIISLIVLAVFVLQLINIVYNIYDMGGWDAYTSEIREAFQKGFEEGQNR